MKEPLTSDAGIEHLAIVLKGYPRLSETFIAQELLALQQRGMNITLQSLRHPTDREIHPIHREITAPVNYLPEYLHDQPARVIKAWWWARQLPGYKAAFAAFLRDFRRDLTRNRIRRFGQACILAAEMAPETTRIYAHFLHTPASVARYAALIRALPWSCSAHAKDIWTTPDWEKREKLADLDWLVTCTGSGRDHLRSLAGDPSRVHLVYHGLDFRRFPAPPDRQISGDGRSASAAVEILSVGRLVEKKGYDLLIAALAALPPDLHWRFTHIGGGDSRNTLAGKARDLGLANRIDWRGAEPQERVLKALKESDIFVLPSRITKNGDRDGLPNVLMEAQSQRLACISTEISAIPELILPGVTGLLVPPDDVPALTEALERLIRDPQQRLRLGKAGEARLRAEFGLEQNIGTLLGLLGVKAREAA
ncbi:glycosyltransferase family 4 protein [Limibacillus sp. MBR-115]|jgi:glycosyltransferase involved in cell wall biosynthesis|uniref:glycosyltransferase family 4 protein n=1 Tax=Limibacillus sp. MBR-115 TaxID=3156465 RepID=UPI003398B3C5